MRDFEGLIPYLPHELDVPLAANRSLIMLRVSSNALFTSGNQGRGPRDKVCVPRITRPGPEVVITCRRSDLGGTEGDGLSLASIRESLDALYIGGGSA